MTAKDVEGARKILQPQGRFHAMRMRDGKPDVRAFSNEEYFATLQAGEAEDARAHVESRGAQSTA